MARNLEWASVGTRRVGFGLLVALFAACSSNGGDTGDAGDGGDGGDGATAVGGCDTSKLPTQDPCVIGDAEGVFVSSSLGSASGDGTKAHPVASLQAGIVAASPTKKRVYACAETYAEAITLASGVSVFGYFDCAQGWAVGTAHAKVKPTTSPAATATNLTAPTRLEAVDLIAPDFVDQSQSSIGLLVAGSPSLTVANATIHAGTGGKGADGAAGTTLTNSGTAKNGASSAWNRFVCAGTLCTGIVIQQVGGSAGGTNACTGASGHAGGSGGNGGSAGEFQALTFDNGISWHWAQQTGYPCTGGGVNPATAQTALGGATGSMNTNPVSVINGGAGADGSPGASGSAGASGGAVGAFSASGYAPSDGTAGGDGQPGQGGGGGGAFGLQYNFDPDFAPGSYQNDYGNGEAGAGGGAGGCPGLAGQAGKGGGASVGVIALQSGFTLDSTKIETSAGGNGGAAGTPSAASAGGTGGSPKKYAGKGGNGGAGGAAGASGSGGGGPSIGIAYQGTQPTLTGSTIAQGQGGAGVTAQTPSSPAGLSKDLYSF